MENIRIQNALDICVIDIEGTIGVAEEWQFDEPQQRIATYEKFRAAVARIEELDAEQVVVNIRSTGGDVNDALLIYDALVSLSAQITTRCYGYVASAATVIAQAASQGQRMISANSLYLIHNSSCSAEGNAEELTSRVELLKKTDEQLAALYARHGVLSGGEYAELMSMDGGRGSWLTATEAIAAGLADVLIESPSGDTTQETTQDATQEEDDKTEKQLEEQEQSQDGVSALWRRISKRIGFSKPSQKTTPQEEYPKCGHSVLHDSDLKLSANYSVIEMEEGQRGVEPSSVTPTQDALLGEAAHSANELAYRADAQRFGR